MNKKRGFTLIEVLAVLVILGLLVTFSGISVAKLKKKQDIQNQMNVVRSILIAARNFEADNPSSFSSGVTVQTLIEKNYVNFDYSNEKLKDYKGATVNYNNLLKIGTSTSKREFYISEVKIGNKKYCFSDCGLETEQSSVKKGKQLCINGTAQDIGTNIIASEGWDTNGVYYNNIGEKSSSNNLK